MATPALHRKKQYAYQTCGYLNFSSLEGYDSISRLNCVKNLRILSGFLYSPHLANVRLEPLPATRRAEILAFIKCPLWVGSRLLVSANIRKPQKSPVSRPPPLTFFQYRYLAFLYLAPHPHSGSVPAIMRP